MLPRFVLIGSGNLATALGLRLHQCGFPILQVYSRTLDHARQLAGNWQGAFTDQLDQINPHADIYLIAVKDDVIMPLSSQLSQYLDAFKIIAHTSGVNGPQLIDPYFQNRALFYPLQSFSKVKRLEWEQIPVFLEGNEHSLSILDSIARAITTRVLIMNDAIRTHLHLASVFANNFTNFNLIIAERILEQAKVPLFVLESLMRETVDKAFTLDPMQAQTGPARRGDEKTIEKHIRLLVTEFPEYRSLYKKYSQIIQQEFKHENHRTDPSS